MKKKIYFRADGNEKIGHGHVMRALAFAEMIKEAFSPVFIIQSPEEDLKQIILTTCESIIELPNHVSLEEEISFLSRSLATNDVLVIDGYHFSSAYQKKLKQGGLKLVCIDDLANQSIYANAIINHSAGFSPQNYSTEFYSRFYLGSEYALLRKPFTDAAKEFRKPSQQSTLFINMGGADPINYTLTALEMAVEESLFKKINVVVGGSYKFSNTLESFKNNSEVSFYSNLSGEQICELMKQSEVAICSSSTVAYEYCSVGGLLFVAKTAENQKYLYDFLLDKKLAFDIAEFKKAASFDILNQINIQRKYFDGKSPQRLQRLITNLIIEDELSVRQAEARDMLTLFHWANDAESRSNSINKEEIPLDSHEKWFNAKLENKDSFIFIVSWDGVDIGQVRFDYKDEYWLISFAVDKKYRRKGLGEIILSKSMEELLRVRHDSIEFKAQVLEGNNASENIFWRLGFEKREFEWLNNSKFYNYYKTYINN